MWRHIIASLRVTARRSPVWRALPERLLPEGFDLLYPVIGRGHDNPVFFVLVYYLGDIEIIIMHDGIHIIMDVRVRGCTFHLGSNEYDGISDFSNKTIMLQY